ncbi:MAG: HEAT repeat domain-containing protein [Myxococcales bacterium]|nr:HEAT repeat domain-containing protein [Myxococcales bacterium]
MSAVRMTGTIVATLVVGAGVAHAAPIASASADLDGDGTAETIELGPDGIVRVAGKLAGSVTVAPTASQGRILVGRRDGKPVIVVDVGPPSARQGVVIVRSGAAWREAVRFPLGGVGLDADYSVEIDAQAGDVFRYQARAGLRRCDGKPALLFAEKFDGAKFQRAGRLPTGVPELAPVIAAKLDGATAPPPVLYRARLASHQIGAGDAGGLGTPGELDDAQPQTMWREELAGFGEGQFFTFEARVPSAKARQLRIVPGNPTSVAALKGSNRPRRIGIVSSQGAWHVDLPDAAGDPLGSAYVADLPEPISGCVTVVLETTYGTPTGQTSIGELEVFAEGERTGGGDALLVKAIADGGDGAKGAAQALAQRGAAGAQAIDTEIARIQDPATRRRLIQALVKIHDPAAGPALTRAALEGWVRDQELLDVIDALASNGLGAELAELAGKASVELPARIAAVRRVGSGPKELPLLVELAGKGPRDLRRAVIDRLSLAPVDALIERAIAQSLATAAGDLWKAITRHARATAADRAPALAALTTALAGATDYERRYRLVDGVATLGDAAAMAALQKQLRALAPGAETSALRQVAIRAVGLAPRPEALGLVLDYATDLDPGVRIAVLSALAGATSDPASPWHTSGGPDGIDRVIISALSTDTWPEIRRRAASALGSRCQRLGPAHALSEAVKADRAVDVRRDALIALVECRAAGIAELLARTWDDGKAPIEVRTQAVDLAVTLGDPQLGTLLVAKFSRWRSEALESAPALALAQSAAASIARLGAPGAAQALIAALDDSAFPEIVSAAALALGALGPNCPPAAKAKLEAIGKTDEQAAPQAKLAARKCGR